MAKRNSASSEDWVDWHGHVRPRPDGALRQCGGPGICPVCNREVAEVRRLFSKPEPSRSPVKIPALTFLLRAFVSVKLLTIRERLVVTKRKINNVYFFLVMDDNGEERAVKYAAKVNGPKFLVGNCVRFKPSLPIPAELEDHIDQQDLRKAGLSLLPPPDSAASLALVEEWSLRAGVLAFTRNQTVE